MAKIFTKLNLGDAVASVGGKCLKKLSIEEEAKEHTVTINLTNPRPASGFGSCVIYDDFNDFEGYTYDNPMKGNIIGEITSAAGSTTVKTSTGKIGIHIKPISSNCGYIRNDPLVTGGVTAVDWSRLLTLSDMYLVFNINGDGTITLDDVDYDD